MKQILYCNASTLTTIYSSVFSRVRLPYIRERIRAYSPIMQTDKRFAVLIMPTDLELANVLGCIVDCGQRSEMNRSSGARLIIWPWRTMPSIEIQSLVFYLSPRLIRLFDLLRVFFFFIPFLSIICVSFVSQNAISWCRLYFNSLMYVNAN